MMRVSEDQHYGFSHEHLYIVVINFNLQSLKQTKDTCWRNWRGGSRHKMIINIDININKVLININVNANIKMKASF